MNPDIVYQTIYQIIYTLDEYGWDNLHNFMHKWTSQHVIEADTMSHLLKKFSEVMDKYCPNDVEGNYDTEGYEITIISCKRLILVDDYLARDAADHNESMF
jgi:hypothetical protein